MNHTTIVTRLAAVAGIGLLSLVRSLQAEDTIFISSDKSDELFKAGVYHQWGNVIVDSPGLLYLTCDDLVANLAGDQSATNAPATASQTSTNNPARLDSLIANGNVAIQLFQFKPGGVTNITYAYGTNAVYTRTNGLVTLTGSPRLETATLKASAEDALYYSVVEGRLTANGRYRVAIKGDMLKQAGFGGRTNKPPAKPAAEIGH